MEDILNQINNKLNVLIGLLLEIKEDNNKKSTPEKERIKKLSDLGMENKDIALVLNKTANQVSKQIYETKRKKDK